MLKVIPLQAYFEDEILYQSSLPRSYNCTRSFEGEDLDFDGYWTLPKIGTGGLQWRRIEWPG
jgi:hypothetical protein